MRKYLLKRDKAYYEGKVCALNECILTLDQLVTTKFGPKENIALYYLRDQLYNMRLDEIIKYNKIKDKLNGNY